MHPNPVFRKEPEARNMEFVRERSFGTLAINSDDGPLMSHVPFELSDDGKTVELHLVRSNPIVRALKTPQKAAIAVTHGDAYVSPDWYEVEDQVPTWNYVAVHVRGQISLLPDDQLHGILDRLTASMETRFLPKKPWTSSKMDQDIYQRMLRQIVPVTMEVASIDGTWKLSQNKPDDVRLLAANGVESHGVGSETKLISERMKNVNT